MNDMAPGPGHNIGDDPEIVALRDKVNEFGQGAVKWGEAGIQSEEDAAKINDFVDGSRALYKRIDTLRKDRKKPHDDAAKAVQAQFKPLLDAIEKAGQTAKTADRVPAAEGA